MLIPDCPSVLSFLRLRFGKEFHFDVKKVCDILHEAFLVVEDVILALYKGDAKHVKHIFWGVQIGAALSVCHQSSDQVVTYFGLDKVLLCPGQIYKLIFRWKVKADETLHELRLLD